ncbi:copper resistance CopC family protein [Falsarthrobacter nasiphocae]|uniref:Methionine-rich copper-binding protein CopC n=1 Tax=Falsarthrobacter nasiphocae TaxID=189863 RepID=A0AAE3YET8_9MICC|nr:copper resistance protein CopC [Falsarthrobacter nasiphocae]MDR6891900.1 methionine-rich copper-binding protein CopC [Falsarthrobacter nasiphocae]
MTRTPGQRGRASRRKQMHGPSRLSAPTALLLGLLVALVAGLWAPAAHAEESFLTAAHPAASAEANPAPLEVRLTFQEAPAAGSLVISVKDSKGREWAPNPPEVTGAVARQPLTAGAPAGTYSVTWEAIRPDGTPAHGRYSYTVTTGREAGTQVQGGPTVPAAPGSTDERKAVEAAGGGQTQPVSIVVFILIMLGVIALLVVGLGARRKLIEKEQADTPPAQTGSRTDDSPRV